MLAALLVAVSCSTCPTPPVISVVGDGWPTTALADAVTTANSCLYGAKITVDGHIRTDSLPTVTAPRIEIILNPGTRISYEPTAGLPLFAVTGRHFGLSGGEIFGSLTDIILLLNGAEYAHVSDTFLWRVDTAIKLVNARLNVFSNVRITATNDYAIVLEGSANENHFYGGQIAGGIGGNIKITDATANVFWVAFEGSMHDPLTQDRVHLLGTAGANRFYGRFEGSGSFRYAVYAGSSTHDNLFGYPSGEIKRINDLGTDNTYLLLGGFRGVVWTTAP
jgi:hypothetical protein